VHESVRKENCTS